MNLHHNSQFTYHSGRKLHLECDTNKELSPAASHQLFYLNEGEIQFSFESKVISLKKHCLLLVPQKLNFSYKVSSNSHIFQCQFSSQLYQVLDLFSFTKIVDFMEVENPQLTKELFTQLITYENDAFQQSYILKLILHVILRNTQSKKSSHDLYRLIPVFEYIEKNIKYSPRIIDLANLLNLDKVYFNNFFKKVVGQTPGQYIQQQKIRTACAMLQDHSTVSVITHELDFYDTSHFCRIFKKVMNETPKQFLQRVKV